EKLIKTGSWRKIEFKNLPFNEKMEIDFHRPYIDEVKFQCPNCGNLMERVPEVIDCWFDSGAMPFGQAHFPFAWAKIRNPKSEIRNYRSLIKKMLFPADYICEGIDQTRGWFYTLLAISTLLGFGPPYKNVISLGHVLDEKGEKMSKSKGNVVDPWDIVEKYGTDAIRWYFYTVNQPGDSKLFSEKEVKENLKKFIL
ncbi:MAG: class I tRNA ligase family protein, partial [Thermodesulfovibrionales bacterium]|nr:class I tRNA ligase family protein [Thermodesulfovibrionales bacterium]